MSYRKNNIKQNKLIISDDLNYLLSELYNDPIAHKIINDSKKDFISTNISWLNLTNNNNLISYSTPINSKKQGGPWVKDNRQASQIRKIIKKIYKREFSNRQIKTFISKFRKVYSDMKLEKIKKKEKDKENDFKFDNDKILENIILYTENDNIKWKIYSNNDYGYVKYSSNIYITRNKYINLKLYYFEQNLKDSYLILSLKNDKDITSMFRELITDVDGIWVLSDIIKNKLKR